MNHYSNQSTTQPIRQAIIRQHTNPDVNSSGEQLHLWLHSTNSRRITVLTTWPGTQWHWPRPRPMTRDQWPMTKDRQQRTTYHSACYSICIKPIPHDHAFDLRSGVRNRAEDQDQQISMQYWRIGTNWALRQKLASATYPNVVAREGKETNRVTVT